MVNETAVNCVYRLTHTVPYIDPMFYLHHAVCPFVSFVEKWADMCVVQMVDKVWYDWQHQDARNMNAFGGGSVSWQVNSTITVIKYTSGGTPWLIVCCDILIKVSLTFYRKVP